MTNAISNPKTEIQNTAKELLFNFMRGNWKEKKKKNYPIGSERASKTQLKMRPVVIIINDLKKKRKRNFFVFAYVVE